MRLTLMTVLLVFIVSCGEGRQFYSAKGKVISLSCEDIWRSSNVLNLEVKSKEFDSILNFTTKLWNINCEQAVELIKQGKQINFQYEKAGRKGPVLVYLKIDGVEIVNNK
jgi:hypothetical protein